MMMGSTALVIKRPAAMSGRTGRTTVVFVKAYSILSPSPSP